MADGGAKMKACKYGAACFRKNADHREKFSHPPLDCGAAEPANERPTTEEVARPTVGEKRPPPPSGDIRSFFTSEPKEKRARTDTTAAATTAADAQVVGSASSSIASVSVDEEVKQRIKEKCLFNMPGDFYALWDLAVQLRADEPTAAFKELGLTLVGPFELLACRTDAAADTADYSLKWRFVCDPAEFQTVAVSDKLHLGYLRDEPDEHAKVVCQVDNHCAHFPKLNIVGDNLFAALLNAGLECEAVTSRVRAAAETGGWSTEANSRAVRERRRAVVAPTLHGAGIVVRVRGDVGYRPLSESNADLRRLLTTIGQTGDEDLRRRKLDALQELITYVQFANDEADFGMGLELGQDLLNSGYDCFGAQIDQLLSVAYQLLRRPQFAQILSAHLANRRPPHAPPP